MDVLFVIGRGSKHNNCELRWALRGLDVHGHNLGKVVVVGYPPEWLDPGTVVARSFPDAPDVGSKHVNIMSCILYAIREGLVSGEFLYSSDDHFMVRDVDLDRYPYWYTADRIQTTEEREKEGKRINNWSRSCDDTRQILERHGLPAVRFDCHMDTHMHTDDAARVEELVNKGPSLGFTLGFEPTDMFMNVRIARENLTLTKAYDKKVGRFEGVASFSETIGTNDTFSISDKVLEGPEFGTLMNLMYRRKSRFEL